MLRTRHTVKIPGESIQLFGDIGAAERLTVSSRDSNRPQRRKLSHGIPGGIPVGREIRGRAVQFGTL
jgi:hypothetical protein